MRIQELQLKKEQLIKDKFTRYKKENKYTSDYIFNKILVPEFLLSKRTLEAIVFGEYDRRREKNALAK